MLSSGAIYFINDIKVTKDALQEYEDLPKDFTSLFETKLFSYDFNLVPSALDLYKELNLKQETLSLIQPQV